MKLTLICLMLTSFMGASRRVEGSSFHCPQALARALDSYCEGINSVESNYKQWPESSNSIEMSSNFAPYENEVVDMIHEAKNRLERQQAVLRECCEKPCYISQLLSYC